LEGKEITLGGVRDNTTICLAVLHKGLKGLLKKNAISHWIEIFLLQQQEDPCPLMAMTYTREVPQSIQDLLSEFKELFIEPQSLPPRRVVDHQIPLIPGAQPINMRPYHYSPQQKNEIE
jgi:hypothetical protein